MLSILIPVFNFDVRTLVKDLHEQCMTAGIAFEILGFDDGSQQVFQDLNQQLKLPFFSYKVMPHNIGRSAIRNKLGAAAAYEYLLFMDCDSKVNDPQYIQKYLNQLSSDTLLYGGRIYSNTPPSDQQYILHWFFGKNREEEPAKDRALNPYHSFMTNNFLIPKSIFLDIQFDESLIQYGHEDTLFGLELKQQNISILHLDNPLEHIGLEPTDVFLQKNKMAIENLNQLSKDHQPIETKLLSTYKQLRKWKLDMVFLNIYGLLENAILNNLSSKTPKLWCLDIYKLGELVSMLKHKNPV